MFVVKRQVVGVEVLSNAGCPPTHTALITVTVPKCCRDRIYEVLIEGLVLYSVADDSAKSTERRRRSR